MKRARRETGASDNNAATEKVVFVVASTGDKEWSKRVRAKCKALGVVSGGLQQQVRGVTQLYVGSYHQEWDDDALDQAQECGALVVTEEFLDRYQPGLRMQQVCLPVGQPEIDETFWGVRSIEGSDVDVERPFPQTYLEFVQMPERLRFGAAHDGDTIVLLNMMRGNDDDRVMDDVALWFRAFFFTNKVHVHNVKVIPKKLPRRNSCVNYQTMLDEIWAQKEHVPHCYAMIGITNQDIYDEESDSTIYGRATGDGGGVVSTFRFSKASSIRCFLSTTVHETLHVCTHSLRVFCFCSTQNVARCLVLTTVATISV
jgi:hypothetical protein